MSLLKGCVASHALEAALNLGRNRFSATRASFLSPLMYASNQALKVTASRTRSVSDCWKARFAFARIAEAFASLRDDSVPHFAAENPDQAATFATIESSSASLIEISRPWRPAVSPTWRPCSPISLPLQPKVLRACGFRPTEFQAGGELAARSRAGASDGARFSRRPRRRPPRLPLAGARPDASSRSRL